MEEIIYIVLLVVTIVLFKWVFKINIKKAKELQENNEAEKINAKYAWK